MEYEHGDAKVKSQQSQMFAAAQAGDTIIVLEVSRLARSTQQLCEIIDVVREKRLRLVIVGSMTLDCREGRSDPMSEAFLQMAGVFSQLELAMIRSRVRSGMANAKAKGKQIGRPQITADSIPAIFLQLSGIHLRFDLVADGVGLGFHFLNHSLVFIQQFNFGKQFDFRHCGDLLYFCFAVSPCCRRSYVFVGSLGYIRRC